MRNGILERRLVQRDDEDDDRGVYRLFVGEDSITQRAISSKATYDDRNQACLVCDREHHEIFPVGLEVIKVYFLVLKHQECDDRHLRLHKSSK